jgi:hypothetical protein
MIYTWACSFCSNADESTLCTVRNTEGIPPTECPYAEYNERGECQTMGTEWKLISRRCPRHGWKLPDELDSCPVCDHEKKIGVKA